jgi:hypothetical protein
MKYVDYLTKQEGEVVEGLETNLISRGGSSKEKIAGK